MQSSFLRSRTFRVWMVCYLVVLLIPTSFGFLLYHYSASKLSQKAYESGMTAVRQVATVVDQQLATAFSIGDTIQVSSGLARLKYISLPFDAEKYYEVHTRAKYLNNFSAQRSLDYLFVYSRDLQCILDAGHIYTETNQYEKVVTQRMGLDLPTFDALMQTFHQRSVYITPGGEKLLILQAFSAQAQAETPSLVLITVLNPEPILAMLRDTAAMHGGSAYMLLPNDTRLGGNEGEAFLRYAELSAMQGEGQISDGEQIVSGVDSDVSSFRFVLTVPHDVLLQDVGHMGMVFVYFILCTLCLGIGSAYMLARHNFKPVQQLKQAAQVPEVAQDEFGAIGNKLVELRDTGHRMHTEIERLSGLENLQLFDALLSGNLGALDARQMSQLAEHFPGEMFIVALLEAQEDHALAIRSAAELAALIQQGGQCAARLGKDQPLVVCCFPAGASPNDAQFFVQQAAEQLSRGQDATPAFSCYIGDAQNQLAGVHASYQNAVRAKEYAEFIAGNEPRVVLYDKTMYDSSIWWEKYDIVDSERRFTNLMIEGNYSAGEQVLREILSYYNGHDGLSLYAMRCRMFGVMNMMLNILHEVEPDVGTAFYEETKPLEALLSARTMQELEDVMFQIVEQLIGRQEQKPAHLQAKLQHIEHYIATHYYDPGMGVRQVADRFGLSLPYLSREFKREKGLGVLQFINTCRIEKAKQIMDCEGNAMVAQIAARVGYNSSQTFIRIFKQYEGITPGQYRTPAVAHKEAEATYELCIVTINIRYLHSICP